MYEFIPAAFAATDQTAQATTATTAAATTTTPQGLSIDPAVIGFQVLNFIILLFLLNLILYKPLTKLLTEREKKIKDGVENAEKAEATLREATSIREDMMKGAKVESQNLIDKARKDGEGLKNNIVGEAQGEAKKIIENGHQVVELEKAKTMQELKSQAVHLVVMTAEKVLREKMDSGKDAKMIEENLNSYAS